MEFRYWEAANGAQPAWDFILNLPDREAARLVKKLEAYEKYPVDALWKAEVFKKVEGMTEVRILLNKRYYRLFGTMNGRECILFYGFVKESKKIPARHLKAAKNNFEEYKSENK